MPDSSRPGRKPTAICLKCNAPEKSPRLLAPAKTAGDKIICLKINQAINAYLQTFGKAFVNEPVIAFSCVRARKSRDPRKLSEKRLSGALQISASDLFERLFAFHFCCQL